MCHLMLIIRGKCSPDVLVCFALSNSFILYLCDIFIKLKKDLFFHLDYINLPFNFSVPLFLFVLQPSLTQTKVPVGEPTVGGVDSACWWRKPAAPSACARKSAGPPSCRCAARTAGSTRTTARFTAPPAWRGDASTWCTARTASSKVAPRSCPVPPALPLARCGKDEVQSVVWRYWQE